jgi:hypothetical protein
MKAKIAMEGRRGRLKTYLVEFLKIKNEKTREEVMTHHALIPECHRQQSCGLG